MSQAPADRLRTVLREAETALESGALEGLDDLAPALAALAGRAREDAIGAPPERLGRLADDLARALAEVPRARAQRESAARRRLAERLASSVSQQQDAAPELAAALRRDRAAGIRALLRPRPETRLADLTRALADLEERAAGAPAPRACGPETLGTWVERTAELLRAAGGLVEAGPRAAWEARLEEARSRAPGATTGSLAATARRLAETAWEIEAALLRRRAVVRAEGERTRLEALDLLLDPDLRPEERMLLESDAAPAGEPAAGGAGGAGADDVAALERHLAAVRALLEGRLARARARLARAIGEARAAGAVPADLGPGADPVIGSLGGVGRYAGGAARLEALADARRAAEIEPRLAAAVAGAWRRLAAGAAGGGRGALLAALGDLKVRAAGETIEAVLEALAALERLAPPAPRPAAGTTAVPRLEAADLAALRDRDPSAAKGVEALVAWAGEWGGEEIGDLLEAAAAEAKSLRAAT